jgi:aryl-alcohol dehydrogenase-like predicted oxidoreductase
MKTVTLGRSGLAASVAGLGTGGHSALGIKAKGQDHAAAIVRAAYEAGVNLFDTATKYGTQAAVGQGLVGLPRDSYILSTKFNFVDKDRGLKPAAELAAALDESLRELRTDYVDIYHLQGIFHDMYAPVCEAYMPALIKAKEAGRIRFLAVSEDFPGDMDHKMLRLALKDDCFDVFMLGYNILNQSAAVTALSQAKAQGVGTLCMYAVRNALSDPAKLRANIRKILDAGQADPALLKEDEDLSFVVKAGAAQSVTEAAYRFAAHTPGLDVILTGTGNVEHLRENVASIRGQALPVDILEKLTRMFGAVNCVAGN